MTRPDPETNDWIPLFDAHSSRAEIEALVEEWVAFALATLVADLAGDVDLTDRDRAYIVARAAPVTRAQTRKVFFTMWERLQAELADASGNTVH